MSEPKPCPFCGSTKLLSDKHIETIVSACRNYQKDSEHLISGEFHRDINKAIAALLADMQDAAT